MNLKLSNFLKRVFSDQKGMSLPLVIVTTTIAIGGILYVSLNLLPKLQDEKKKTQSVVAYRIFVSGITDYIVHAVRERWCVNSLTAGKKKKIINSDLLLSNDCGSQKKMEDIVTYPGNLERILWDQNTIGPKGIFPCTAANRPPPESSNTILAINCLRNLDGKTTTKLNYDDIEPVDGKMTFHITEDILKDMTDQHPLFIITKDVRQCIKSVDITLERMSDIDNSSQGEEKKLTVSIATNFYKSKISCLFLREVSARADYAFYPRRLHNFSLIKYGDLPATLQNEFHSPVYVAGDLILPVTTADKTKTSIFYDRLTLGTFNSGSPDNIMRMGKIRNNDGTEFTFEERGDPYLGKQDSYQGFRGILGGLRLDAVEDKGFYNLFDYNPKTGGNVSILELCIDENQVTTRPSLSKDSVLAYKNPATAGNAFSYKIGLSEKNRFKLATTAPKVLIDSSYGKTTEPGINFGINVPAPPNGTKSLGVLRFNDGTDVYSATVGVGSQVNLVLNIESFGIDSGTLTTFKTKADPVNKNNYDKVFGSNVLEDLAENTTFKQKALALINKCDTAPSNDCADLGYTATGAAIYTTELSQFKSAQTALKNKIEDLKTSFNLPEAAQMVFTVENLPLNVDNKLIINQKLFKSNFTDKWKAFSPILNLTKVDLRFTAYHYGSQTLRLESALYLGPANANTFKLKNQDDGTYASFNSSNWYDVNEHKLLPYMVLTKQIKEPVEIVEVECPDGMGLADWDLDMSESTNFAWTYANSPVGVLVETNTHEPQPTLIFEKPTATSSPSEIEGYTNKATGAVINACIIPANRDYVYGLYVCNELRIKPRTTDLYMIGTFIVNNLNLEGSGYKVIWHSLWSPVAADLIMKDFNHPPWSSNNKCVGLESKTLKDLFGNVLMNKTLEICSPQELINNGPNNFTWTTIDPDIGLASPSDVMTSQKVKRPTRWEILEISRKDEVRL